MPTAWRVELGWGLPDRGSGKTIVPVAGLVAPVAGAIATRYACLAAAWSVVSERRL
jgi:hypothetical protein